MYSIEYSKAALKDLSRIPRNTAETIRRKISQLATDPYGEHNNAKKLQGLKMYRLRVGDWRVFYEIHNDKLVILVLQISPRGGAYKK